MIRSETFTLIETFGNSQFKTLDPVWVCPSLDAGPERHYYLLGIPAKPGIQKEQNQQTLIGIRDRSRPKVIRW